MENQREYLSISAFVKLIDFQISIAFQTQTNIQPSQNRLQNKTNNSHNNTKQQRRTNFSLQHTTPRHQDTGGKKELKAVTIYNYK